MTHQKPTAEELNKGITEALNVPAEDAPKVPDEKPDDQNPDAGDQANKEKKPDGDPAGNKDDQEKGKKDEDPEETPEEKETKELRKKVANSTRENQIISAQNKKMAEAFDKATEVPEPTEEELQKVYPQWDGLSDFEKMMAKDKVMNDRRFAAIKEASKDFKDLDQWQKKVTDFIDDPESLQKHPLIQGKEDEFKLYAMKPTRRGVDFEDLVAGFLFTYDSNKPSNKGKKMFPVGSGGDKKSVKPVDTKLSVSESEKLRQTNYQEYKRQLRAGNISSEIPA